MTFEMFLVGVERTNEKASIRRILVKAKFDSSWLNLWRDLLIFGQKRHTLVAEIRKGCEYQRSVRILFPVLPEENSAFG